MFDIKPSARPDKLMKVDITQAAKLMFVTQPAVSLAIRELGDVQSKKIHCPSEGKNQ